MLYEAKEQMKAVISEIDNLIIQEGFNEDFNTFLICCNAFGMGDVSLKLNPSRYSLILEALKENTNSVVLGYGPMPDVERILLKNGSTIYLNKVKI